MQNTIEKMFLTVKIGTNKEFKECLKIITASLIDEIAIGREKEKIKNKVNQLVTPRSLLQSRTVDDNITPRSRKSNGSIDATSAIPMRFTPVYMTPYTPNQGTQSVKHVRRHTDAVSTTSGA